MTTPDTDVLITRAQAWLAEDPDEQTRDELTRVIAAVEAGDADARVDLADRFRGTLEFGTAGLRGALGAGPNRMNRIVVIRAASGLASYLIAGGTEPGTPVVIGYDARHNSDVFARDTAEVMAGAGLKPLLLPRPLPTPLLAYAIRELGCAAGVMVTASHNPPQDNGYKVYLGDGSQIVPPADTGIAEHIAAVGSLRAVAREPLESTGGRVLDEGIVDAYLDTAASIAGDGPRDLAIVYTPLHGVGGGALPAVLETAGFTEPQIVAEQEHPDADFPTVSFPNPEEPGAIDLAVALAERNGADIVIANDPDADRCAAAVPDPDGGWRMLRGDEVGALLADHLLRAGRTGVYATSIVSSSLLGTMAAAHGQRYAETLTGFKWIGRLPDLVFGYEEALGYCVDPVNVADKDGVTAALLLCEIAAEAKDAGRSLLDLLDDIAVAHGLHATDQLSVRVTDLGQIATAMERLRATPPTSLGGSAVTSAEDLTVGSADLPPTDGLRYRTDDGSRVVVRPSGTEPKLKCYLEVVVPVADGDVAAARADAATRLAGLRADIAAAAGI
ncbi:phosphomannomutase [Nocardioides sp. Root190]|uniref:phospho-sugar mutase n=1 Tax=Nocardioides sp. Root190 TaxID=1736488 RepID=UPI0006F58FB3|nr:phospho-sugar mutase [Nocardioides sp. Root190]KRB79560.1 phosphomannomutase [Nocardioides sp. Root190]